MNFGDKNIDKNDFKKIIFDSIANVLIEKIKSIVLLKLNLKLDKWLN